MNNDKDMIDVELNEWLKTEDQAEGLRDVVNRVNRFATGEEPAGDLVRKVKLGLARETHSRRGSLLRLAMAASLILVAAGVGFYIGQPRGGTEIAWGDVVSAMQQVNQFHITAFGDDSGGPLKVYRLETYYQRPNYWRSQGLNFIQFGAGPDVKIYSVNEGKFLEPGPRVPRLVPVDLAAAIERENLLDAIVAWLFSPNKPPVGQVVNDASMRDAGIQVFDYGDPARGQCARIWVIERSRLPIRLEVTDANTGFKTVATFDYSESAPPDFFDADLFQKKVEAGGPPTTREAYENHFVVDEVSAWYRLASNWNEPAATLKYSENPADMPVSGILPEHERLQGYAVGAADKLKEFNAMDRTGVWPPKVLPDGVRYIKAVNLNLGPVDFVPVYHANGSKALMDEPQIFAHERTSTSGVTRLVTVSSPGFMDSLLTFQFKQIGPSGSTYAWLRGDRVSIDMTGICGPGEIRLYAGQADEKDASRFSIPFEANGKRGWIDGQFVGDTGKLSLRMGGQ
jgi:hypothetical protein